MYSNLFVLVEYILDRNDKERPTLANLFFIYEGIITTVTADAPASRIDKKKSSQKSAFFLPIRFHLTLILQLQRRNACPIILLPRNFCINTIRFFQL